MRHNWFAAAVLGASWVVAVQATAQQAPKMVNAQLHTESVGSGLSAAVTQIERAGGAQWLGYEVAGRAGFHASICSSNSGGSAGSIDTECCGEYQLEATIQNFRTTNNESSPADTRVDVLVRIDQGQVDKIRYVSAGCQLNGGGLPFTWLTDVKVDDSVTWLSSLVSGSETADGKRHADQAMATIAVHATGKATEALAGFASAKNPEWMREKAAFWLGADRGHDGLLALEKLTSDGDSAFRKKLVFDFSMNREPAAVEDLIRMAKSDADIRVREEAIFWVGQKASKKAVELLKDVVANDPEEAVKKKAVFAISQLPKDQSVPELVHVAQTNSNATVRKEAIFWLGQTRDPRALAYFEQVLLK